MWRRRTLLVGLGTVLGACGFRPMYLAQGKAAGPVRTELAAIEVQGLGGRLGYLLREALLDELNPATAAVPPRYVLSVQLSSRADALGIQLDATITRYNLLLIAAFELRAKEPYADLTASHTAERRAAQEVAIEIRTLLAVQFARAPAVT